MGDPPERRPEAQPRQARLTGSAVSLPPRPAAPGSRPGAGAHLVGHPLAVLLGGVDQRLVQVDHEHQLPVPVQPLLVLPSQLLRLLRLKRKKAKVRMLPSKTKSRFIKNERKPSAVPRRLRRLPVVRTTQGLCLVPLILQWHRVRKPIKEEEKASIVPTKTQLDATSSPHQGASD